MSGKAKMHSSPENVARPRVTYYTARRLSLVALCAAIATITVYACNFYLISASQDAHNRTHRVPLNAKHTLRQCAMLKATPGPATEASFRRARETSDRFEPGTRPTLIKDAHIWTGARNGTETVAGDVLLSGGVIKGIGYIPRRLLEDLTDLVTIDAKGGWVTPGLGTEHMCTLYSGYVAQYIIHSGFALPCRCTEYTCNTRYLRRQLCAWTGPPVAS